MSETWQHILTFVQNNVELAPYLIFALLLLAGFNLPISEDLMLFISAILATKNPEFLWPLFIGVFSGAYLSDVICYAFVGRFLGPKVFKIKFFSNMITQDKIDQVGHFYEKYGILTLLFGRFIPFGVRNALFFTAGLSKMNAWKFCFSDLLACLISCSTFFYLYFKFGETVVSYVKKGNIAIFAVFIVATTLVFLKKKYRNQKT